jgi:hypothetical protein
MPDTSVPATLWGYQDGRLNGDRGRWPKARTLPRRDPGHRPQLLGIPACWEPVRNVGPETPLTND